MANRRIRSSTFRRALGQRLRARRLALSLSQEEVALETDVTQGSISNYEAGRSDIPFVVLLSLCRALDVELHDLVPAEHLMRSGTVFRRESGTDTRSDSSSLYAVRGAS